jgi:hypothetical protein
MKMGYLPVLLALLSAAPSIASPVLCKAKKGGLAIRDKCKHSESQVSADVMAQLGLKGDKGDPGGPALVVEDANGQALGLLVSPFSTSLGAIGLVIRQMTLPGRPGPQSFLLQVTTAGLHSLLPPTLLHLAANCGDPPYSPTDPEALPAPFAEELEFGADGIAYYTNPGESAVHDQYYAGIEVGGSTGDTAKSNCTQPSSVPGFPPPPAGVLLSDPHPCAIPNPISPVCVTCCSPDSYSGPAGPAHAFDVKTLGFVPPFRLRVSAPLNP